MSQQPFLFAAAEQRGHAFLRAWNAREAAYCGVLAYTETCLIPGVSAAGVSDELRPLTPAADAEVVLLGQSVCLPRLPSHPTGAAGPAGITRAALQMAGVVPIFVGIGLPVWPAVACTRLSEIGGADIRAGRAVPEAVALFAAGQVLGRDLARSHAWLMIGESVPGGTTTALSVLLALGYAADGRVSGSSPGNAHHLKSLVAHGALDAAGLGPGDGRRDVLGAIAAVGDPMQPVVCGVLLAAAERGVPVLLAGGSQMVAVAALAAALCGRDVLDRCAIGTTRWVVADRSADVSGLVGEISPDLPLVAANLDFGASRRPELRLYEAGLVKEGVGAGGSALAALCCSGVDLEALHNRIDAVYEDLLGRLTADTANAAADSCRGEPCSPSENEKGQPDR